MALERSTAVFGFLNIAKPVAVTAHDVVNSVRKILGIKQVGHGGTLDPLATGVLPIAVGKATRLLRFLPGNKTYLAEIKLGISTSTDDITGPALGSSSDLPDARDIIELLPALEGDQQQVPPLYSAVHVDGQRLYRLARQGNAPPVVPARSVNIKSIRFVSYNPPLLTVRVECSAGTYIRSIARDLGSRLGCGACLNALVREQAGPFLLSQSVSVDAVKQALAAGNPEKSHLLAPQQVLNLDRVVVEQSQAEHLRHGRSIAIAAAAWAASHKAIAAASYCSPSLEDNYILTMCDGRIVAICRAGANSDPAFVKIQPEVVIDDAAGKNNQPQ